MSRTRRSTPPAPSLLLSLFAVVALAAGCPNELPGEDAGPTPGNDDAGTPVDSGTPEDDAGEEPQPDAGPGPEPDAGEPGGDAGPGDAGCVVEDPCDGVEVTGQLRFEAGAPGINLFGTGGTTLAVGQATRADVEAAFGAAVSTENPFRGWHCGYGMRVEYVDDLDGSDFEGNGSAGDIVARVVTLPGVDLSSGYGVTPGMTRADAQAALADPVSVDLDGAGFDASASDGLSVVSDASGEVTTVALFKPQETAAWTLPVDVPGAAVGSGAARLAYGDDLSDADAVLGTGWDAQGIVSIDIGVVDLDVLVRIYASYGVRIAARCPLTGSCNAGNATVQQIILSPPFLGQTSGGLRLGSPEDGFTAAFGAGVPSEESEDLLAYEIGARDLAVAYVEDAACTRRAAALVLNYTEAP